MAKNWIFISYRRDDTLAASKAIFDSFANYFGVDFVFRDLDTLAEKMGSNFVNIIETTLDDTILELVLIGPKWITPRLNNPEDFVRREIEIALSKKITVVPLLIDNAPMPPQNALPSSLRPLCTLQAWPVNTQRSYQSSIEKLIKSLEYEHDLISIVKRREHNIQRPPTNPVLEAAYIEGLESKKNRELASLQHTASLWSQILSTDPNFHDGEIKEELQLGRQSITRLQVDQLRADANIAQQNHNQRKQIQIHHEIIKISPNDESAKRSLLSYYQERAQGAMMKGDWADAIVAWGQIIALQPGDKEAIIKLEQAQKNQAGDRIYDKICQLPNSADAIAQKLFDELWQIAPQYGDPKRQRLDRFPKVKTPSQKEEEKRKVTEKERTAALHYQQQQAKRDSAKILFQILLFFASCGILIAFIDHSLFTYGTTLGPDVTKVVILLESVIFLSTLLFSFMNDSDEYATGTILGSTITYVVCVEWYFCQFFVDPTLLHKTAGVSPGENLSWFQWIVASLGVLLFGGVLAIFWGIIPILLGSFIGNRLKDRFV